MVSVSAAVVPVAVISLVGTATATGASSGAGFAVAAANSAACILCMASPVGWFMSEGKYNDAASSIQYEKSALAPLVANVAEAWSGESMEAFQRYYDQRVVPALDGLQAVTKSLGQVMNAGGHAQVTFLLGLVGATATLIGAFVAIQAAAAASGPAYFATVQAQWAPAAAWIAFAIGTAKLIQDQMKSISAALNEIETTHLPALKGATDKIGDIDPLAKPAITPIGEAKKVSEVIDQYKVGG